MKSKYSRGGAKGRPPPPLCPPPAGYVGADSPNKRISIFCARLTLTYTFFPIQEIKLAHSFELREFIDSETSLCQW